MNYKVLIRDTYFFILLLLAFLLPFPRLSSTILLYLLGFIWLISPKQKIQSINFKYLPFIFIGVYSLGLIYSSNISYGVFTLEKKLPLAILPISILFSYSLDKIRIQKILAFFTAGIFISILVCLIFAFYRNIFWDDPSLILKYSFQKNFNIRSSIKWDYFSYSELLIPLKIHPTYYGIFLLIVMAYIAERIFNQKKIRLIDYFLLFLLLLIILVLSSRIIVIILLFFEFPFILMLLKNRFGGKKSFLFIIISFFLFITVLFTLPVSRYRIINEITSYKSVKSESEYTGVNMRRLHWKAGFNVFKTHPIIGTGTGSVQDFLDIEYKKLNAEGLLGFNTHNQYLQVAAELGILGLISFISLSILPIFYFYKCKDYFITVIFAFFAAAFLTECLLNNFTGILSYSFFYSIFGNLYPKRYSINK